MTASAEIRGLARGGALSFVGSATSAAAGFALVVVLGRGLGTAGSGAVLQAIAVFSIALSVCRFGMDGVAVWLLPRLSQSSITDVRAATLIMGASVSLVSLVATGIVIALSGVLSGANGQTTADAIGALAWFLPAGGLLILALAISRGLGGVAPYVFIGSIGLPLIRLAAVAAALGLGVLWTSVAWGAPQVPALAVAVIVGWRRIRALESRRGEVGSLRPTRALARTVLAYGSSRTLSAALEQVLLWADVLIVGMIAGNAASGIYGGASRFVMAGLIVDTAIRVVVSPRLSALLHRENLEGAQHLYGVAAQWLVLFSTPIYLLAMVYAPTLLALLGREFVEGSSVLMILSVGALITLSAGNIHSLLLMSGRSGLALLNKAIVVTANIAGDTVLVPRFGINGAAVMWAFCMLLDAGLAAYEVHRFVGISMDARTLGYGLLVPLATVLPPALLVAASLGRDSMLGLVLATTTAGVLFVTWCVVDRRRLRFSEIRSPAASNS